MTVGYGDLVPKTNPQRLFTAFWIIFGVTITGSYISQLNERVYRYNEMARQQRELKAEQAIAAITESNDFSRGLSPKYALLIFV